MRKIKGFLHRPHELAIAELMGYQSTLSEATYPIPVNTDGGPSDFTDF